MREYIIPNWHAILVHAPLGLLTTGLALEILTLLWRRSSARVAARWMIVVGAVMAVPALTSGIYAYHDVIAPTTTADEDFTMKWDDLMSQTIKDRVPDSRSTDAKTIDEVEVRKALAGRLGEELRHHIWRNSIALGGIFLVVVTFIGCSDFWRRRLYLPLLVVLIASQGMMVNGAHNGGLVVYQEGAAVQPLDPGKPSEIKPTLEETIKQYAPPAQVHFTMAGWLVGLALVALGLSIRAIGEGNAAVAGPTPDEEWFQTQQSNLAAPQPGAASQAYQSTSDASAGILDREPTTPFAVVEPAASEERREINRPFSPPGAAVRTTTAATTVTGPVALAPAGRFWLLAFLAGAITFAAGLWLISAWKWDALMAVFRGENRNRYHIITGTSIVVLTLVLALMARFARRAKLALVIFSVLLFGAIALQIYLGVLLSFDGTRGPSGGLITPLRWTVPKKEAAQAPIRSVPVLSEHHA